MGCNTVWGQYFRECIRENSTGICCWSLCIASRSSVIFSWPILFSRLMVEGSGCTKPQTGDEEASANSSPFQCFGHRILVIVGVISCSVMIFIRAFRDGTWISTRVWRCTNCSHVTPLAHNCFNIWRVSLWGIYTLSANLVHNQEQQHKINAKLVTGNWIRISYQSWLPWTLIFQPSDFASRPVQFAMFSARSLTPYEMTMQ